MFVPRNNVYIRQIAPDPNFPGVGVPMVTDDSLYDRFAALYALKIRNAREVREVEKEIAEEVAQVRAEEEARRKAEEAQRKAEKARKDVEEAQRKAESETRRAKEAWKRVKEKKKQLNENKKKRKHNQVRFDSKVDEIAAPTPSKKRKINELIRIIDPGSTGASFRSGFARRPFEAQPSHVYHTFSHSETYMHRYTSDPMVQRIR